MEFCKSCGGLLFFLREKGIVKVYCKTCRNTRERLPTTFKETVPTKIIGEGVSSNENPLASYTNICKKCGHNGAEIINVGVLISDEDNLSFLKCGKCGFSERVGRKVT